MGLVSYSSLFQEECRKCIWRSYDDRKQSSNEYTNFIQGVWEVIGPNVDVLDA